MFRYLAIVIITTLIVASPIGDPAYQVLRPTTGAVTKWVMRDLQRENSRRKAILVYDQDTGQLNRVTVEDVRDLLELAKTADE